MTKTCNPSAIRSERSAKSFAPECFFNASEPITRTRRDFGRESSGRSIPSPGRISARANAAAVVPSGSNRAQFSNRCRSFFCGQNCSSNGATFNAPNSPRTSASIRAAVFPVTCGTVKVNSCFAFSAGEILQTDSPEATLTVPIMTRQLILKVSVLRLSLMMITLLVNCSPSRKRDPAYTRSRLGRRYKRTGAPATGETLRPRSVGSKYSFSSGRPRSKSVLSSPPAHEL